MEELDWPGLLAGATEPQEFVLKQFEKHDAVFVGESHGIRENLEFLQGLLPRLHARGVYDVCFEFGRIEDQRLIDQVLGAAEWHESAARQILFNLDPFWGYRQYVDVYRAAWELNRSLPKGARPLRIWGLFSSYDWSQLRPGETPFELGPKNRIQGRGHHYFDRINEEWAWTILDNVVNQGRKALVYGGTGHTSCKFRYERGPMTPHFTSAGNLVYNAIGERACEVILHSRFSEKWSHHELHWTLEKALADVSREKQRAAFDLATSPLGKIPTQMQGYAGGHGGPLTVGECHDGLIVLAAASELHAVDIIPDFIHEQNLATANRRAHLAKDRVYTLEEMRGLLRKRLEGYARGLMGKDKGQA